MFSWFSYMYIYKTFNNVPIFHFSDMNSQQASGAAIDHDYTEVLTGAEKLTAAEQYIPFLESLT